MNKKLTVAQQETLENLSEHPIQYADKVNRAATLKALVTAKYARLTGVRSGWEITESGCDYLGISYDLVMVTYAEKKLKDAAWMIRHCVQQIHWQRTWSRLDDYLAFEYFKRSFSDNERNTSEYHALAIELARAEIRAGIAK